MNVVGPRTRVLARFGVGVALALTALAVAGWQGWAPRLYALAAIPATMLFLVCVRPAIARRDPLAWVVQRPLKCHDGLLVGQRWHPEAYRRPRPLRVQGHTITIAPSGTGKSVTAMAALAEWDGLAVVTDPKGELFAATAGYRPGPVYQWAVNRAVSPIGIAALYGGYAEAVDQLIDALTPPGADHFHHQPFSIPWGRALQALLLDAAHRGLPPWTTATRTGPNPEDLAAIPPTSPGYRYAQEALQTASSPGYWGSIQGTGAMLLAPLRQLAPALDAPAPPLDDDSEPPTIYITGLGSTTPSSPDAVLTRWLLGALWTHQKKRRPRRALYLIDEAGIIAPSLLAEAVAIGRGYNVIVWAIAQSLHQLVSAYGFSNAQALQDAINGPLIVYPGNDTQWVEKKLLSSLRNGDQVTPVLAQRWASLAAATMADRRIGLLVHHGAIELVIPCAPPPAQGADPVPLRPPQGMAPVPPRPPQGTTLPPLRLPKE